MPKEITFSDSPPFVILDDGNEVQANKRPAAANHLDAMQRGVHIGWSHDQYVEIGVGMWEISTHSAQPGGQYTTLDRTGLNRLIRHLRKARDAAFGSDA